MIAGLNDPDVARFMSLISQPYTPVDAEEWLERCRAAWTEGSSHPYAIADAETNEFLGSIEVRPSNGVVGDAPRARAGNCDASPRAHPRALPRHRTVADQAPGERRKSARSRRRASAASA